MDLFTQRNTAFYYHVDSFQGKPVDAYINFIIPFVSLWSHRYREDSSAALQNDS